MSQSILVVDDEPNIQLSYRLALETENYVLSPATNGRKALDLLAKTSFDLVLLDVRMPEMDGLQLLARMRDLGYTTPVIMITAHGDVPHAVAAMKLGAIDFLKKPLTPVELRKIVLEILERHGKSRPPLPEESDPSLSVEELHACHLQEAKRLLNLMDFGPARKQISQAMALDPLSAEAFNVAGVLFELLADHDRARKYYDQAAKLDKNYQPAQQNIRRIQELSHTGSSQQPYSLGEN